MQPQPLSLSIIQIIYMSLILVGAIVLLFTVTSYTAGSIIGSIVGYSFIGSGILLLVGLLIHNLMSKQSTFMGGVYTLAPFSIILGVIIYSMYLLIHYKERISQGNISSGYTNFTNISVILIMLQLYLFYSATQNENFKQTSRLDKVNSMFLLLIGIINIISVVTLGVILAYFTTDG